MRSTPSSELTAEDSFVRKLLESSYVHPLTNLPLHLRKIGFQVSGARVVYGTSGDKSGKIPSVGAGQTSAPFEVKEQAGNGLLPQSRAEHDQSTANVRPMRRVLSERRLRGLGRNL